MMSVQRNASHFDHRSLPGPGNIHREALLNGMTVLVRSNFNSPSVAIGGVF